MDAVLLTSALLETDIPFQRAMAQATREIIGQPGVKTTYDICNGYCEEWADRVVRQVPEAEIVDPR